MKRMLRRWLAVGWVLPLAGCALGPVRQVRVAALGPHEDSHGVTVTVQGEVPEEVRQPLQQSFQTAVEARAQRGADPGSGEGPLRVELRVVEALAAQAPVSDAGRLAQRAQSLLGLAGLGSRGGLLTLEGVLLSPEGREPLGHVWWSAVGEPAALAARGGREAGEALGREMAARREDFVNRRAADERLFFTPTALTLEPGEVVLSNDELLLFRLGVGLGRRVQLDFWGGGLPIPAAGAAPLPVGVVGGAGVGVLAALDVGLKVKLLEEGRYSPGVALSYDFLDLFAGGVGAGGFVFFGHGVGAVGAVGAAAANLQLNLFSAVVGKHVGDFHFTVGTYVVDNHHLIPQGAVVTLTGAGVGDGAVGTGENTEATRLERLPTQVQPFVGAQYVIGPHSEVAAEFFPRLPFSQSVLTTGVRWLLGSSAPPTGPLATDRLRVRLDLAALWVFVPADSRSGAFAVPLPWLGVGLYKL